MKLNESRKVIGTGADPDCHARENKSTKAKARCTPVAIL
jgi:hypothetical protein